jgi:hypothetical protein
VGQVLLLRLAVGEFPRGTPVKIVAAVTADGTCAVEPYVADTRSTELVASRRAFRTACEMAREPGV